MSWAKWFQKAARFVWKHRKVVVVAAYSLIDGIRKLAPKIRDWWNGKKIAIIGPTAVGKDCLYCRLQDKPIPDKHNQTKEAEKVPSFPFRKTLPSGKEFSVTFKRCINVGGEVEQRKRYWLDCCTNADVIFYMFTIGDLKKGRYRKGTRVWRDLRWLATNMEEMKPNSLVHFLVNKIDLELADGDDYKTFLPKITPQLEEFEATAKSIFGDYEARLTGVSPVSMTNDYLFARSFPKVLEAVYEAVHQK